MDISSPRAISLRHPHWAIFTVIPGQRLLLVLVIAVGALLRFYQLGMNSLWYDEIGQVLVGRKSLWNTITASARDAGSAPLDYVITHFALFFGQNETILRFPAAVFGVLSILVLYLIGKAVFDRTTGLTAAALLAIAPNHLHYSRQMRFYSLAVFMILFSVLTFYWAISSRKLRFWVLNSVVTTLALYSHYYTIFIIAACGLWLLLTLITRQQPWNVFWRFILSASISVAIFSVWVYYDNVVASGRKVGLDEAELVIPGGLSKFILAPFLYIPNLDQRALEPLEVRLWIYAAWVACLIALLQAVISFRKKPEMLLLLLIPIVNLPGVLLLDYLGRYMFAPRQTLIFSPYLLLSIAAVCAAAANRVAGRRTYVVITGMILLGFVTYRGMIADELNSRPDIREVARFLQANVGPHDVVVVPLVARRDAPDRLAFYAPELRSQMIEVRAERGTIDRTMRRALSCYERVWAVPWVSPWRQPLKDWAEEYDAETFIPNPGWPVHMKEHTAGADCQGSGWN